DGAGNLFVSDYSNATIRKLALATGEVTTVAGKPGTTGSDDGVGSLARFNRPEGLAMDGMGSLFITEFGNYTIRKLALATGQVPTVAGAPMQKGWSDGVDSARFFGPADIAIDRAGNLFISDWGNRTIRELVLATGQVTTIAGAAGQS